MKVQFRRWACETRWAHYSASGETALRLVDAKTGEPVATATVCLYPPNRRAGEEEIWLKGWSENDGLPEALEKAGIVTLTSERGLAGLSTATLARLTPAAPAELKAAYEADPAMAADRATAMARV